MCVDECGCVCVRARVYCIINYLYLICNFKKFWMCFIHIKNTINIFKIYIRKLLIYLNRLFYLLNYCKKYIFFSLSCTFLLALFLFSIWLIFSLFYKIFYMTVSNYYCIYVFEKKIVINFWYIINFENNL